MGYTYPLAGTRVLQIDVDPAAFVNHRSPELAVLADAGAALAALVERLPDPVPLPAMRAGSETWLTGGGSKTLLPSPRRRPWATAFRTRRSCGS